MNKAFIIFLKYPEYGKVKTRLSAKLGESVTLELYKNFIKDIYQITLFIEANVYVCFSYNDVLNEYKFFFNKSFCYFEQRGGTLGCRMYNAFSKVFSEDYEQVVMVGSDSPDLPHEFVNIAYEKLNNDNIVIGPSHDGGYYLIGMKNNTLHKNLFADINWSTESVLNETLARVRSLNYKYSLLPSWHDIDTFDDLKLFCKRNSKNNKMYSVHFLKEQSLF